MHQTTTRTQSLSEFERLHRVPRCPQVFERALMRGLRQLLVAWPASHGEVKEHTDGNE